MTDRLADRHPVGRTDRRPTVVGRHGGKGVVGDRRSGGRAFKDRPPVAARPPADFSREVDRMNEHTVDSTWAVATAARHTAVIVAIEQLLDHVDDVVAALSDDDQVVSQSRALAALLRTRRDDLVSEARRLNGAYADA